jgi:hypothetical protein
VFGVVGSRYLESVVEIVGNYYHLELLFEVYGSYYFLESVVVVVGTHSLPVIYNMDIQLPFY